MSCSSSKLKTISVDDIKVELAADEADYSKAPQALTIKIDEKPHLKDGLLIVGAKIINPTNEPISYYAHEYPVPLILKVNGQSPVQSNARGPSSRNLRPIKVTIPSNSIVTIEGGLDLSQYNYVGEPTVKVDWMFKYWSGERPTGEFKAKLPKRFQEIYLVDGHEVTKEEFEARKKSRKISAVMSGVEDIFRYVETGEAVPHNIAEEKGFARIYQSNGTVYKPGYVMIVENWSDGKKHILSKADVIENEYEDIHLQVGKPQSLKSGLVVELKELEFETLEEQSKGISVQIGLKEGKKKQDLHLNLLAPPYFGQRTAEWRTHRFELLTIKENTVLLRIRGQNQKIVGGMFK
jgi:hypothetical protein